MVVSRGRRNRYSAPTSLSITGSVGQSGRDYVSEQSGSRRHDFISQPVTSPITLGDYTVANLVKMQRTFTAADDTPDTPTASNNYETHSVMNGSKIVNFRSTFRINSVQSGDGIYLDVYSVTTSFADALYLNALFPSTSPVEFEEADVTPSHGGEVQFKAAHPAWTENIYKDRKTLQRYIKHLGTIFVTSEDGGSPSAEFTVNGLPANVRRSQTGMFYGIFFHYSASKNSAATGDVEISQDTSFKEIPADNRLPFKW